MGQKIDFVYLTATMPGRHSGDQVHKVKKAAAPLLLCLLVFRYGKGCYGHPNVTGHAEMANLTSGVMGAVLGWK